MIKNKLLILLVALFATTALWAQNNVITYTATSKLTETTNIIGSGIESGLHTDAFNVSITSHTFNNGRGTITFAGKVTMIGDYAFFDCIELTSVSIPNSVTTIGGWAFFSCSGLTSVTIPNSVTTIGDYAFSGVNNIVYGGTAAGSPWDAKCVNGYVDGYLVYSNATKTTLCGCSSAATGEIVIPPSVTTIKNSAFSKCSGLTSVTIPNSVTTIENFAFYWCSGLTSITIGNSVTTIGDNAFCYCSSLTSITIGNSVTTIGDWAFSGCSSLTKTNYTGTIADWCKIKFANSSSNPVNYSHNFYINDIEVKDLVIPEGVESIGNNAFYNCSGLTSVTIPNSVTTIGDYAFSGCTGLTSVTIPNSVTTIGERAFSGCTGLTSVTIPNSVTTIGEGAFAWCSGLTSVTIPNSVTTIGDYAFSSCTGLTSVTIPNSVTTIGEDAFYWCSGLTSVTIPNSVTTIGDYAFSSCTGLTSVTIPNSVTTIGSKAFYNVLNIVYHGTATGSPWGAKNVNKYVEGYLIYDDDTQKVLCACSTAAIGEIVIPSSVTTIKSNAFSGCSGLTSVTIPNSVTTIGSYAFYNVLNIVYHGTATGSPWGAKCVNGYVDGYLVYSDATKTTLCGCSSAVTGEIVIPNSVTTIGDRAFYSCDGLTSVTIPNSVKTIGNNAFYGCKNVYYEDYFNQNSSSFPSNIKCKNPISCSLDKKIFNVSASLSIPEIYYEWYDEIGLADSKTSTANHYAADTNGKIVFANMPLNYSGMYYFYARQGEEYVYQGTITISTKTPSLSCSSSSTQTTITLSNISASTDTSVHSLSKGIYYNYKRYEADENNKVVITGIVPNTKCTLQIYGCYNGNYYYGDSKYITTQAIAPTLTVTESPTCVYAKGSYTHGDATILGTSVACTTTGSSVAGDEGLMTGLKPNTDYSFTYSVDTKEGGTYTATKTITTPALTITTLTPKVVSAGNVVVAASTNISDLETNVGFEWRKYNAPPELPSSRAQAILYSGQMEGILHNLSLEYWKVRAYYEAADGTCYYGEWATFDPSQPAYFEPTVHTYALVTDPTVNKVQMRGYVMTGTDEVTEQGFEYWFKGSKAPRRVASATPDSIYRVQASGQVMTAVLEDLAYSTTYTCRAYAVAGGKTYYGEEVQFLTPEDPRPIYTLSVIAGENGSVNTDVSGQYREGETVTLTATPMAGYRFLQWSDGNMDNPRQLTIMADTELVALFELADGLEQLIIDNAQSTVRKFIHNNQLFIFHNGNLFTATGARVK